MPRFDVSLHIEIDADDAETAYANVRDNYTVFNKLGFVSFVVDDEIYEIDDNRFLEIF